MRKTAALALILAAAAALPAEERQYGDIMHRDIVEDLNEAASAHYLAAQQAWDAVDPDAMMTHLFEAAQAQPGFIDLQFFVLDRLIRRAEVTYGEDSVAYYEKANQLIDGLKRVERIQPSDADRLAGLDQRINGRPAQGELPAKPGEINAVQARDLARLETGLALMFTVAARRLDERGVELIKRPADGGEAEPVLAFSTMPGETKKARVDPFAALPGEQTLGGVLGAVNTAAVNIQNQAQQQLNQPGGNPFGGGAPPANPFAAGGAPPANPFAAEPESSPEI
ncbi:MAG: hypothetical protein SF028_10110 [Candidatus Sumerlaeia bacterium]|nr:hypothetical protein [Candidatus Sumerlaeia bacterium]